MSPPGLGLVAGAYHLPTRCPHDDKREPLRPPRSSPSVENQMIYGTAVVDRWAYINHMACALSGWLSIDLNQIRLIVLLAVSLAPAPDSPSFEDDAGDPRPPDTDPPRELARGERSSIFC